MVAVLVFGDVIAFDIAVDGAGRDHRDLAFERHEGLEDRGFGAEFVPDAVDVVALADHRLALAVIAEAAGLQHAGTPQRRDGRLRTTRASVPEAESASRGQPKSKKNARGPPW